MRTRCATSLVLTLSLGYVLGSPGASRADELEKALLKEAPKIVQFLQEKGYRNVGVLKFRVKKGDGPASAAAGTLNLDVARRLEVALLLANDPKKPLGVIAGASGIADTIPGANHLTAEGRKPLFRPGYALAWGEEKVAPDAFLTGTVEIAADFKRLTVGVLAFDKDGGPLTKVAVIDAACDADVMVSGGESFMVRGAFDQGHTEQFTAKIIDTAHRVKTGEAKNPWEDRTAPVQLDVVYDGKRVPVEVREGRAWVREPREGEKVEFVLRRLDDSKDRFAAALLVNGENTFYKERLPPEQCTKWVLDPGCGPLTVSGFKTGENKGEAFRVMSRAESKRNEMYYGADVGTITLVVFREKTWKEDPKLPTDEEEDLAAIHRGLLPEKPPANLGALKRQLRSDDNRGLIGSGETIKVETVKVKFNTAPTPVMALTITYYKPQ